MPGVKKEPTLWDSIGDWAIKYHDYYPRKINRDAVQFMDRAGSEYFDEARALVKKKGGYHRLSSLERVKVDALNALSGGSYYVSSVAKYLGPKTGTDWIVDVAAIGSGGAGLLTKAPTAAKIPVKALEAIHTGKLLHRAAKIREIFGSPKLRSNQTAGLIPRPKWVHPIDYIKIEYPDSMKPRSRPRQRNISRPSGPSYSFLDPVKVADWSLRYGQRSASPATNRYNPFMSTVDRLKQLERQAMDREKTQQWLRKVDQDLQRGIKYQTPEQRRAMEKRYGVDSIAKSWKPTPVPTKPVLIPQSVVDNIWKAHTDRSRSSQQPSTIRPSTSLSRPLQKVNPSRQMGRGPVNRPTQITDPLKQAARSLMR
jgi:hypothetical protein